MEKLRESLRGAKAFLQDVGAEARKTTWPERGELLDSTVVVIVSVFLLSLFVGVCDRVLMLLLRALVPVI
jgi:preprotein translocase subunit SecE